MKSKLFFWMLVLSIITFVKCSSSDSSPNTVTSQFKNKWWYSIHHAVVKHYFNSNGTYELVNSLGGIPTHSVGQWEWIDEPNKTFRVYNLIDNPDAEHYGKILNLTEHDLQIAISFDNGVTYEPYDYMDVGD